MACWFLAKKLAFKDPPSLKFHNRTDIKCLKTTFFKVVAGATNIQNSKDKCKQVQTIKETKNPDGFEKFSASTDIIILVLYEPFTYKECGIQPVKLAEPNDVKKIGEYG